LPKESKLARFWFWASVAMAAEKKWQELDL
jgi:hypothetical protein